MIQDKVLNDRLQELFEDFDSNHPAFDRIDAFEARLEPDMRAFILHKLDHWMGKAVVDDPRHREYITMMFGFVLGTEFAKRGYEVTA